jgi:hypothetical protein
MQLGLHLKGSESCGSVPNEVTEAQGGGAGDSRLPAMIWLMRLRAPRSGANSVGMTPNQSGSRMGFHTRYGILLSSLKRWRGASIIKDRKSCR